TYHEGRVGDVETGPATTPRVVNDDEIDHAMVAPGVGSDEAIEQIAEGSACDETEGDEPPAVQFGAPHHVDDPNQHRDPDRHEDDGVLDLADDTERGATVER